MSSYIASQASGEGDHGARADLSPRLLHKTRSRPASLGSGKDFTQVDGSPLDTMRSLPMATASGSSGDQKRPRSSGISVLICPRANNVEDRREALKKLGLLRN